MVKTYFVPEIIEFNEITPDGKDICNSIRPAWHPKDAKRMKHIDGGFLLTTDEKRPKNIKGIKVM